MEPMKSIGADRWWPESLGDHPNSAGGQNEMRYAYFAGKNRLAIDTGNGAITVYDTAGHRVSGVQQDQSGNGRKLAFTGDGKTISLDDLKKVSD